MSNLIMMQRWPPALSHFLVPSYGPYITGIGVHLLSSSVRYSEPSYDVVSTYVYHLRRAPGSKHDHDCTYITCACARFHRSGGSPSMHWPSANTFAPQSHASTVCVSIKSDAPGYFPSVSHLTTRSHAVCRSRG